MTAVVDDDAVGLMLLQHLVIHDVIANTFEWAKQNQTVSHLTHDTVANQVKSLQSRSLVTAKAVSLQFNVLTDEGQETVKQGTPERRVYTAVSRTPDGVDKDKLFADFPNGVGPAMKNKWISVNAGRYFANPDKAAEVEADAVAAQLRGDLDKLDAATSTALKKRQMLKVLNVTAYEVRKGAKFTTTPAKLATDIDVAMLATGAWRTVEWKPHNVAALGARPDGGHLHPLMKVRAEYRQIFLEMGLVEMRTNRWVESSFWNFDALFQPQQHPARDAHDTFFISEPAKGPDAHAPTPEYVARVQAMHEHGGEGSIGYRYNWSLAEAQKNILRTHTTAVSSRTLFELAKDFKPRKFFSIDRVFRNEALDATHLAEFHQIEGVIIGPDLTLGDLIGTIKEFFERVGVTKIKFKPAYNPYTEPSMEVFAYHDVLRKWVEIGNSGMFRPEMLLPMGLPANVRAIAWGFGLERPTMIKYGINNIRDLCGHKLDLNFVKTNPACRLDK